jgi:hypothetical protein
VGTHGSAGSAAGFPGNEQWLSAKTADCRLGTVVARQDAKVAKSAKKSR